MTHIVKLPPEIILKVLNKLGYKAIFVCRATCRTVRTIVDESLAIQYKLELETNGLRHGTPDVNISMSERLARVQRYAAAWNAMQWSYHVTVPLPPAEGLDFIDVHTRAFAFAPGDIMASTVASSDVVEVTQMPSMLRGVPRRDWSIRHGLNVCKFAIDPSQDLLVLVQQEELMSPPQYSVHLLSLTSGEPHPAAYAGSLMFRGWIYGQQDKMELVVLGRHIGVLRRIQTISEVYVWDWMTGELTVKMNGTNFHTLALLPGDKMVLGCSKDQNMSSDVPGLFVVSFDQVENASYLHGSTYFALPPLAHKAKVVSFTLQVSAASMDGEGVFGHDGEYVMTASYGISPQATFSGDRPTRAATSFVHFIAPAGFEPHLAEGKRVHHTVLWEEWGPKHTRLLVNVSGGAFSTSGTQFVHALSRRRMATVLDFHPVRVGKAAQREEEDEGGKVKVVRAAQPVFVAGCFADSVVTELKYVQKEVAMPPQAAGLMQMMLWGDRLVGVTRGPGDKTMHILTI